MTHGDAVERFRTLLRIPTVSRADAATTDWSAFERFRDALAACYPATWAALSHELVAEHTLLLRWPGRDASLPPIVLLAHQDVVDPGDPDDWSHDPFGAELDGDTLHARGAIDDKGSLVAILEAVGALVAAGHRPERDVLLVFGHDEETHGTGAAAAAALLAERGVRPLVVLDEGGAIVDGVLPGVAGQLAVIGITEKGTVTVRLRVAGAGGHASTPPPISAIGRLARAITRIDAHPFPARLTPATRGMFAAAGRAASGLRGFLYRHPSLTGPLLLRALRSGGPETAAMVRTTSVATMISGGHARNAVPERAEASVNLRVLSGETIAGTVERLRATIADPLVELEPDGWEPAPFSPTDGPGWDLVTGVLAEVRPEVLPVPYGQTGATDARSFTGLTPAVYRFTPFHLLPGERAALHAANERVRVPSWLGGIDYYAALLRRA